jgi:cobalt-zinc-cadmium resistance protein CzcA
MLDRLLEFSIRQRVFVLLATLVLVGIGVRSALRLPIDAVPDITNVQVQINTEVLAFAPEEIEKLVTFPVENEMAGIPGLAELRSLSKFGLSQVTLVFEEGTDLYRSRQLVSERLQTVIDELPPGLTPKLAPISTGLSDIYYYVIEYAPTATNKPATREAQLMELKLIHDYSIKPRLRSTPGLAEVNASGGYEKQIVIQPNPDKLKSVGMSFSEIADAIGENVENAGGSVIQLGGEQVAVRAAGRVQTVAEIEQLPLKFGSRATPLHVRDVADVGIGKSVRTGASHLQRRGSRAGGGAHAGRREQPSSSPSAWPPSSKEIQTKLPPGVRIIPVYDRTELVDRTIRHGGEESVRGRGPRRGRAAAAAGQLAGGAHRRPGHPALASVGHHGHGAGAGVRQPDEPGRGGLRAHHRWRGRDGGEHHPPPRRRSSTSWADG